MDAQLDIYFHVVLIVALLAIILLGVRDNDKDYR